jgi:regulator of protease activity HflC (stomatin/prohibitin superfamily)
MKMMTAMTGMKKFNIGAHERGFLFENGDFKVVLQPGRHWFFDPVDRIRVDVLSVRDAALRHKDLDVIVRSGALKAETLVVDIKDGQRALVWIDGRFDTVLKPGLYAFWTVFHDVRVEVIDATLVKFEHAQLQAILGARGVLDAFELHCVAANTIGLYFKDGEFQGALRPGNHVFWKNIARIVVVAVDLREQTLDIAGQEIMTADKVTLRLNALVTYRVADPLKSISEIDDVRQALYREAQLALRAVIGTRELDALLTEKDTVAAELEEALRKRAKAFGLDIFAIGIRDVILPGEMKDLMNKVTEARKAAEAALITRREETAAIRMQANTAKIFESNPTLMRMRELEVLEKVVSKTNLTVVTGEKGLADKVMKLL